MDNWETPAFKCFHEEFFIFFYFYVFLVCLVIYFQSVSKESVQTTTEFEVSFSVFEIGLEVF